MDPLSDAEQINIRKQNLINYVNVKDTLEQLRHLSAMELESFRDDDTQQLCTNWRIKH